MSLRKFVASLIYLLRHRRKQAVSPRAYWTVTTGSTVIRGNVVSNNTTTTNRTDTR